MFDHKCIYDITDKMSGEDEQPALPYKRFYVNGHHFYVS